jgi:hypothetical protein
MPGDANTICPATCSCTIDIGISSTYHVFVTYNAGCSVSDGDRVSPLHVHIHCTVQTDGASCCTAAVHMGAHAGSCGRRTHNHVSDHSSIKLTETSTARQGHLRHISTCRCHTCPLAIGLPQKLSTDACMMNHRQHAEHSSTMSCNNCILQAGRSWLPISPVQVPCGILDLSAKHLPTFSS